MECNICTRTAWYKLATSSFSLKISRGFSLSRGLRLWIALPIKSTRGAWRMSFQRGLWQVSCESRRLVPATWQPLQGCLRTGWDYLNSQCLREYLVWKVPSSKGSTPNFPPRAPDFPPHTPFNFTSVVIRIESSEVNPGKVEKWKTSLQIGSRLSQEFSFPPQHSLMHCSVWTSG